MYQGEVNVKQSELQAFMTIAETLQIKGLATNSNNSSNVNQTKTPDSLSSSYNQFHHGGNNNLSNNGRNHNQTHYNTAGSGGNHAESHRQNTSTPSSVTSSIDNHSMKGENCANFVIYISQLLMSVDFRRKIGRVNFSRVRAKACIRPNELW